MLAIGLGNVLHTQTRKRRQLRRRTSIILILALWIAMGSLLRFEENVMGKQELVATDDSGYLDECSESNLFG